jgi:RNA polymerase sigma-70 factor (ECF subfamily)
MNEQQALDVVNRLYESWYSTMVRYATRACGRADTAKECVQEAFLLLYQRIRYGEEIDNPKAWTFAVVRRRACMEIRRESVLDSIDQSSELLESLAAPEPAFFDADWEHEADRLFAVLSQREEEVVLLRLQALKYREIAEQLGIATQTVSALLVRALKKLRREIDAHGSGEPALSRANERFRNKQALH